MIRTYQRELENLTHDEAAKAAELAEIRTRRAHLEGEIATKTIELNRLEADAGRQECQNEEVSHDAIERRAYEIYLARGGEHGHADEDWAQAEAELRGKLGSSGQEN
jgi:chromosome segregation ATPase